MIFTHLNHHPRLKTKFFCEFGVLGGEKCRLGPGP